MTAPHASTTRGLWHRHTVVDLVIVSVLTILTQLEIWAPRWMPGVGDVTGSRPFLSVTAAVATAALLMRRRLPLTTGLVVSAMSLVQVIVTEPTEGIAAMVTGMVAVASLAAYADLLLASVGAIAAVGAFAANDFADVVFVAVVMGAAWAVGRTQHRRLSREAVMMSEQALLIERQHDAAARGAAEERIRIARELHDIVAHRVSMIVVQAQAADAMWSARPDDARETIRSIDEGARAALGELRSMLGIMRDHATTTDLQPQPGLDSIGELTEGARQAGVPVDLVCQGDLADVPTMVSMAAYRIVQEALTNVTKHADRAHTTVLIRRSPDELLVHVLDDGRSDVARPMTAAGYGLAGMRERVAVLNGAFRSGPAEHGGFEVWASLPLPGGTKR